MTVQSIRQDLQNVTNRGKMGTLGSYPNYDMVVNLRYDEFSYSKHDE